MITETPAPVKRRKPWRWYNIVIHRYLGYYFAGLTVIYAISGVAVNHIDDWNPNYQTETRKTAIAPLKDASNLTEIEAQRIFQRLGVTASYNPSNVFYPDEKMIQIVLAKEEKLTIDLGTSQAIWEQVQRRPFLHTFNFLHLNAAKKWWTFYADFYAICLLTIALTGLVMKKGRQGLWGMGGLIAIAGMVAPLLLLFMDY